MPFSRRGAVARRPRGAPEVTWAKRLVTDAPLAPAALSRKNVCRPTTGRSAGVEIMVAPQWKSALFHGDSPNRPSTLQRKFDVPLPQRERDSGGSARFRVELTGQRPSPAMRSERHKSSDVCRVFGATAAAGRDTQLCAAAAQEVGQGEKRRSVQRTTRILVRPEGRRNGQPRRQGFRDRGLGGANQALACQTLTPDRLIDGVGCRPRLVVISKTGAPRATARLFPQTLTSNLPWPAKAIRFGCCWDAQGHRVQDLTRGSACTPASPSRHMCAFADGAGRPGQLGAGGSLRFVVAPNQHRGRPVGVDARVG